MDNLVSLETGGKGVVLKRQAWGTDGSKDPLLGQHISFRGTAIILPPFLEGNKLIKGQSLQDCHTPIAR